MAVKLDGKKLSIKLTNDLQVETKTLKNQGIIPKLAVILVGDDPASRVYVRNKHRMAEKIGIESLDLRLAKDTSEAELLEKIALLNNDPTINGILVQLPLPDQINADRITKTISPKKDVDGFHPYNLGRLFVNDPYAIPCTPNGIMYLLREYGISVDRKNVVIVGRSKIVGRPLAALMLNQNATVTVAHSHTKNLSEITRQADILVAAVGRVNFIQAQDVKPGAIVIDVGINRNAAGKLVGDVEQTEVGQVAGYLTPVPGGVGPMTIAMLMKQTIEFAKWSKQEK
ncbi:bifunctional methylenetetrahydrofolate dehydrogenase/methenyltetrahydrofolate cyclohydrolase FolD [Liquorilactobacillus vini]|uniref:Bifunctional protein FolD n=1 Tax=Liquorilactobacillus vini DSM 20605 TaxID=1133569 RepID=A0A0R2CDS1_9LACO|nr:bifunctional methylenetetrahydrofolate dehydrogenase/methenyltetrahydrofolate cyclohydrolase FolD [Liquorilactobacillus vini]KRM86523.1 methylenetetrahydrofolate dehydrogenase (nadp+) methenyltetrahydrofolate cyclohydrolase [Liquorilactobacillus vini DSM 20605]